MSAPAAAGGPSSDGIRVTALSITPVKGTRLRAVERIALEPEGVHENRRFYVIDARDHLANGKRLGALTTIVSDFSARDRRLTLHFPDGSVLQDQVDVGETIATRFFSATVPGRIVAGEFSAALSEHLGEPVRLVEATQAGGAVDRGARGVASLISRASLQRLADAAGESSVDARRFRMLIEIDGVSAHEEDAWVGGQVSVGGAVIAWGGHVGRCLITSRDPDSGEIDLPTLDILRDYRGQERTTEPLPFGIFGGVISGGQVRVGDAVRLHPA